jgi:signal transduction histidine kinase
MTSWWRLRTQAYLVLGALLFLIVFLGTYALSEAKHHTIEADELLNANFKAASILKQVEVARAEEIRTMAKFRVTKDPAYKATSQKQQDKVTDFIDQLQAILGKDPTLAPFVKTMIEIRTSETADNGRPLPTFLPQLHDLDRKLETQRAERAERIRQVASDLGKIIFITVLIATAVTSWLAIMLYHAVLKPLESIKRATTRIREGELSYRVAEFGGFAELRALRKEFNAMASKLEELDRMKGDFLSTVSHELRTPLTALKEGIAFLAEKQSQLNPSVVARTLEVCNQSAKRLETMIQNLLNHAKMESGFYSFDERPKNFLSVIETAIQGVKPIAERRKIAIELDVQSKDPVRHFTAAFSTEGVTHAIENLLLNAIKYGDNAYPIEVEVRRETGSLSAVPYIELRVRNHGKGLLPTELTQVFERFFRASNADGQQGVGLGLSVVKRIVEAHHGTVAAESVDSRTTFSFRIPQLAPEAIARGPVLEGRA